MAGQGISGNQIAKKLDMHVNTVNGILRRNQSGKFKYTTHCYTCEYSIYSDRASTKRAMPTVKGCLLRCDTPKTCRNWLDDERTAQRVKAGLRGKYEVRRANEEKAIHKQEGDQPCAVPNDGGTESSHSHESGEQGT